MAQRPGSLYIDRGDHFEATQLTRGPWSPVHQHAGPPAALLARAMEQTTGIAYGQFSRFSFEILAPVPIAPLRIKAKPLRPGKRVELLEASLTPVGADKPVIRARAWRFERGKSEPLDDVAHPSPAGPDAGDVGVLPFMGDAPGYQDVLEWRFTKGGFDTEGPAAGWTRMRVSLVEGEQPTPIHHLLCMADAGNGISAALDWNEWLFINVDLTVHIQRPPVGEWIGMDARTRIGDTGMGVANTVLFDAAGRVGTGAQSLLVAPR
jgi:hypothetical protein